VLAIDTTAPVIGVALLADGRVRSRVDRVQRGSEAVLVPWAEALCEQAGLRLSELSGVAVARGPGAFTGLRVGLATAIGVALAAGVPVWGESSLRTRGLRAVRRGGDVPVLAVLDARKGRVYAASYDPSGHAEQGPGDLPPEQALAWMKPGFLAIGEGALVYRELVERAGGVVVPEADHPAVDVLAQLGAAALARGEGADPASVRPVYLRKPDARLPGRPPTR